MWDWSCRSLFLLAPSFCFDYSANKGGHLGLLLHSFKAEQGRRAADCQICLLISGPWVFCPHKCVRTKCSWIVSYSSELRTYLTFFVVSNKKVFLSVWHSCRKFVDSHLTDREHLEGGCLLKWLEHFICISSLCLPVVDVSGVALIYATTAQMI